MCSHFYPNKPRVHKCLNVPTGGLKVCVRETYTPFLQDEQSSQLDENSGGKNCQNFQSFKPADKRNTHTQSQIYIHDTPTHSSKSKNADVLDSCGQFLVALSTYKQYSHCSSFGGRGRSAQHLQGWMLDSDSGSKSFPETPQEKEITISIFMGLCQKQKSKNW